MQNSSKVQSYLHQVHSKQSKVNFCHVNARVGCQFQVTIYIQARLRRVYTTHSTSAARRIYSGLRKVIDSDG